MVYAWASYTKAFYINSYFPCILWVDTLFVWKYGNNETGLCWYSCLSQILSLQAVLFHSFFFACTLHLQWWAISWRIVVFFTWTVLDWYFLFICAFVSLISVFWSFCVFCAFSPAAEENFRVVGFEVEPMRSVTTSYIN